MEGVLPGSVIKMSWFLFMLSQLVAPHLVLSCRLRSVIAIEPFDEADDVILRLPFPASTTAPGGETIPCREVR